MKITYLHQYFNTPKNSGGTRSYEMARRLVEKGHTVNMITSIRDANSNQDNLWYETTEEGINVHWIAVSYSNEMNYYSRIKAFLHFAWYASHKASMLEGDVILATSTPLTIALPATYAKWKNKIPMVFEVRDLWPELPIAIGAIRGCIPISTTRKLEKFAYQNSTKIVALSPGMKEGILKQGYPEQDVHVIPNSCDIELFDVPKERGLQFRAQYDWLQERPLIVYTGTLGRINGVEYLIHVAHEMMKFAPEICFLVVGTGYEERKIRDLAFTKNVLERNFFILSSLPKSDMPSVLSAATIATSLFINLPEMWNNSANKFFDALASGTPLAINYRGWQAELLEKYQAGIILSVDNYVDSAKKLMDFITDSTQIELAKKATVQLAQQFERGLMTEKLEQILYDAIGSYNSTP